MYKCKVCNKFFDKPTEKGYTSYCSNSCNTKFQRLNNPKSYYKAQANCWRASVKKKFECCICGFSRALDRCHLEWRKDGGKVNKQNITILCPNHHRLFDQQQLTAEELRLVRPISAIGKQIYEN